MAVNRQLALAFSWLGFHLLAWVGGLFVAN